MPRIILASASSYRSLLLARLGLPFESIAANVDESRLDGESAEAMVTRLSILKARTVALVHPDAVIIASDQAGVAGDRLLGKPGSTETAIAQLHSVSAREVRFLTGLCVLDPASGQEHIAVETCRVRFRALNDASIRDYVEREQPLDCAGSFKVEGLGIALFEQLELDDPTSLEGLPLIRLTSFLAQIGINVLAR
ncbi:MAG: septum formation protein Maf [Gammaproteobacteria bacterium]|nr:septum formation protein Maf [Gammaproteobacteria bacterium]